MTVANHQLDIYGVDLHWIRHDIRGDNGNGEPSAYLTGWLTAWLWKHTHIEGAR